MPPVGPTGGTPAPSPPANKWRHAELTWYKPSLGGINGTEGAGACPGVKIYDHVWGVAAPPEYPCGTKIEFRYRGRSVVVPVVDRGGAIVGDNFDLLPGPARRLRMMEAGRVSGQFRVRSRNVPIGSAAAGPGTGVGGNNGSTAEPISFQLPAGPLDLAQSAVEAIGGASNPLTLGKDAIVLATKIVADIGLLFQASTWFRIGKVLVGVILGIMGVYYLLTGSTPRDIAKTAQSAATKI